MFRIDKDQGPEAIKEILSRLFTLRGLGRRQGRLHLEKAWEAAAGLDVSKKTRVLSLKRGVFEVEVNGPETRSGAEGGWGWRRKHGANRGAACGMLLNC